LGNLKRHLVCEVAALAWLFVIAPWAEADQIPYPNVGFYNPTTYSFTAKASGDVIAYFAGSSAADDNQLGMLDNGALTSAGFGLDDHTSFVGQSFDLGHVNVGDSIVFVLHNLTVGLDAYSDPSLNIPYDSPGETIGHNHIYSTLYTATSPILASIPTGVYVAFEDLQFPSSDFNYFDETYVFTNVGVQSVPEPSSALLGILAAGAVGAGVMLRRWVLHKPFHRRSVSMPAA
jgi:hypothetical protein